MKKKTSLKKLSLSRETLDILDDQKMIAILGGAIPETRGNTIAECCLG